MSEPAPQVPQRWNRHRHGKDVRGYFHGTTACLSALFTAGRYEELMALVQADSFWPYKQ